MESNFKTLCACLALVMCAENLIAGEKDVQNTNSQSQKESTDSQGQKRKMSQEVLHKWIDAAKKGDINTIRSYIDQNYDINAKNNAGDTALTRAAYYGRTETAKLLLDYGADINVKDKDGKTALDYAKEKNSKEIVKYLEQAEQKQKIIKL